jgi:hypothetical protein
MRDFGSLKGAVFSARISLRRVSLRGIGPADGRMRKDLFDGRRCPSFFTYHGFITITTSSRIISSDLCYIINIYF